MKPNPKSGLLVGIAVCGVMVLATFVRYPGDASARATHLQYAAFSALALLLASGAVLLLESRTRTGDDCEDRRLGLLTGAVTGAIWVFEICFNNFAPRAMAASRPRFLVDNVAWGAIALGLFAASASRSWLTRRFKPAVRTGAYSGLLSGLIACGMGLLLILGGMGAILHDPMNVDEFAARGPAEHATDMATYFAYETLSGALGHLLVLGILMGLLLGAIAGGSGLLARRVVGRPSLNPDR